MVNEGMNSQKRTNSNKTIEKLQTSLGTSHQYPKNLKDLSPVPATGPGLLYLMSNDINSRSSSLLN